MFKTIHCPLFFLGFLLQCSPLFAQFTYQEDFENGMPLSYTLINADGLNPAQEADSLFKEQAWMVLESELMDSHTAISISWYENDAGPADDWMVLPKLEFGEEVKLIWRAMSSTLGDYPDSYEVLFSSQTPTLENLATLDPMLILRVEEEQHLSPIAHAVDASALAGRVGHIIFRNITPSGDALLIDDISISNVAEVFSNLEKVNAQTFDLQLFPNPSNIQSTLQYRLHTPSKVTISLQNASGQTVWKMKEKEQQAAGLHQLSLTAMDLPKGMYWLQLQTETEYAVSKWVVE